MEDMGEVGPEKIIHVVSEEAEVKMEELFRKGSKSSVRGLLTELLYRCDRLSNREIGELMGLDYSAVSIGSNKFQDLVKKDRMLSKLLGRVRQKLSHG